MAVYLDRAVGGGGWVFVQSAGVRVCGRDAMELVCWGRGGKGRDGMGWDE
jgi:hypothetical protein